ncbi:WcaI family glycosyltransferase [Mycobacterium sp. pV006]|uniref:WcaI family glycosyltransferase n=1 Tax=Mycobacterium sp. pV006 TaxID=3238983 RepID=UPI00351AF845
MRITVVGINYAPELTGIAPYTTGFAEGMAHSGHEVNVVTAPPHYPEWRIAPGYENAYGTTSSINGVQVRRVRCRVPARPSPRGRVLLEASFAQAAVRASWHRPDLVVAVSPTLMSAGAVVARARLAKLPCGVIVQDLYSSGVVETGAMSGWPARAVAQFEGAVLNGADGVAVIHAKFVDSIAKLGVRQDKVTVIRNWTHIAPPNDEVPVAEVRAAHNWTPDEILAIHTGNMGVKQGLENVVDAAVFQARREHPGRRVRFVLIGDGNQRALLEQRARGVPGLEILEPLPEDEFRGVLAAADVLLVNEKPGVGEMAVPSKLTSYFVSGRPVVAATDPGSATACEIQLSGGGILVPPGDPEALLSTVQTIGSDEEIAQRLGASGRTYARETLDAGFAIRSYERWCTSLIARRR